MAQIIIPSKRYNKNVKSLSEDLSRNEIFDICKLLKIEKVDIVLDNTRSFGRYVIVKNDDDNYFVGVSNREVGGRNSFTQTIATIYAAYINSNLKYKYLCYYFLKISGNNLTPYLKFCYRLTATIPFKFINANIGFGKWVAMPYSNVRDIIEDRNLLKQKNRANNSSYLTDEGDAYHIYGKSFGANSKETALICFAISSITDKPIKLFQILDNESKSLSDNDKNAIIALKKIKIIDDTFYFDKTDFIPEETDNIRSARFIFNLFQKYGNKHCALCGCKIENLICGAHIWPVSNIKKSTFSIEQKKKFATDADNGIWLCENHHKLFDTNIIKIEHGYVSYNKDIRQDDISFLNHITTNSHIEIDSEMQHYFDERYK